MASKKTEASVWQVIEPWADRDKLAGQLRVPALVSQLLYNRGISTVEQGREFLQPSLKDLIEPEKLTGIAAAVKRIRRGLDNKDKIVIYGDYDVDGIAGVSILWECFELAGHEVDFYVPHRLDEGYGLNVEAVRELAGKGVKLIITVDCGVAAFDSAAEAKRLGVDLVITDHHKVKGGAVEAEAVVHPDLPGQEYPNKQLCGAGVAFKLAWALAQEFSGAMKVSEKFRDFLLSAVSLVALGTVADIVELKGENRTLTVFGMNGLVASKNTGIRALIDAAGLKGVKLHSSDLGFKLAPRLNAAGRMGHARLAIELFTKSSVQKAVEIAGYLESQNRLRQKVEKEITEQALSQIVALGMNSDSWRGLVVAEDNWHGGVIGIVASRIVDKYNRPTIVIGRNGSKAMGSCRSVRGFDIHEALLHCNEHLISFGGHAMAAGLNIRPDNIESLRVAFNNYASEHLTKDSLVKKLEIDAEVSLAELDLPTVKLIEGMGPFGTGNPYIKLVSRGLRLVGQPQRMGKQADHLAMTVCQPPGGTMMRAVAFSRGDLEKKLIDAESFDIVFEPTVNRFNGNYHVEMHVKDIKVL
jgi:single-stranded-DNA-specific exonuclease